MFNQRRRPWADATNVSCLLGHWGGMAEGLYDVNNNLFAFSHLKPAKKPSIWDQSSQKYSLDLASWPRWH